MDVWFVYILLNQLHNTNDVILQTEHNYQSNIHVGVKDGKAEKSKILAVSFFFVLSLPVLLAT